MKKTSKKTKTYWRKKCETLAKKIAVLRDKEKCQKCGNTKQNGYQIHGSHILSVGAHPTLCAELLNIEALCAKCHSPMFKGSWHEDPAGNIQLFEKRKPGRLKLLQLMERKLLGTIDWEKKYLELKKQYDRDTTS